VLLYSLRYSYLIFLIKLLISCLSLRKFNRGFKPRLSNSTNISCWEAINSITSKISFKVLLRNLSSLVDISYLTNFMLSFPIFPPLNQILQIMRLVRLEWISLNFLQCEFLHSKLHYVYFVIAFINCV
jgi:hypothetical protein